MNVFTFFRISKRVHRIAACDAVILQLHYVGVGFILALDFDVYLPCIAYSNANKESIPAASVLKL